MSINDLELTSLIRKIKSSITGHGEPCINMDELAGMGKGRELKARLEVIEIAARLAQQRLGEIT